MTIETKYNIGDMVEFETSLKKGIGIIAMISTLHDGIDDEDAISYVVKVEDSNGYTKVYEREIIKKIDSQTLKNNSNKCNYDRRTD